MFFHEHYELQSLEVQWSPALSDLKTLHFKSIVTFDTFLILGHRQMKIWFWMQAQFNCKKTENQWIISSLKDGHFTIHSNTLFLLINTFLTVDNTWTFDSHVKMSEHCHALPIPTDYRCHIVTRTERSPILLGPGYPPIDGLAGTPPIH